MKLPFISCLCVTKANIELLTRSINCFLYQSYLNRELIIIYEEHSLLSQHFQNKYANCNIYFYEVSSNPKLTLGQLRNISIDKSSGDYFCQWDDDDWYHPDRLKIQMNSLIKSNKSVSALNHWLMYDSIEDVSYCSYNRIWEGSLLCRKDLIYKLYSYPDDNKGEDTAFVYEICKRYGLCLLLNPNLYIYIYQGSNTWAREHFLGLYSKSYKLSQNTNLQIKKIVNKNSVYNNTLYSNTEFLDDSALREIKHAISYFANK